MSLFLTACFQQGGDDGSFIERAEAFRQGTRYYASVKLTPAYLAQVRSLLAHGESVVGSYRLRLSRERTLWPDLELRDVTFKRRLRPQLILQRYEMEEAKGPGSETRTTPDLDEALRFLGQPSYIPLIESGRLEPDEIYRLEVFFRIEREGDSRTFRLLQRLLSFGEPTEHLLTVEFRNS